MTLRYLYSPSDNDPTIDITDNCRLYQLEVTNSAEEGAVGVSTLIVDDEEGVLDLVGLKNIVISETEATAPYTIIGLFYAAERKISRGPYRTGAGRIWTVTLADINTIADWRVMVGSDANRPAESDVARMTWLMSTSELGQVEDTTFLSTAGPVAMDAVDYRGQKSSDIINDCMQASGKNCFIYYREADLVPALWYDFATSSQYTSDIRLTNDLDDILDDLTGMTYEISFDSDLTRDPSRVFSGAYVQYDGGAVYEQLPSTYEAFRRRDAMVPADNVKTNAKATARANRYLATMSSEEDRITCSVRLPPARVNWIREGQRVLFRATHMPGYQGAFSYQRVLQRTVKQDSEVNYLVTLTLAAEPSDDSPPAGPADVYFEGDNGLEVWVNGTFIGNNSSDHKTNPIAIPDSVLVPGDNVLAIRVTNGVEPATWALGNPTYLEARLFPSGGGLLFVSTGSTVKTWDVSNLGGALGGTPANWNEASFDDSGWADAIDVTGDSAITAPDPISPARYVAPAGAPTGTYARGLVWLARMDFTAS